MKPGSEPAYPVRLNEWIEHEGTAHQVDASYSGLTIRQYFVAKAMQGALTAAIRETGAMIDNVDLFSEDCIKVADACIRRELETREE